ncbi:hypothetical protein PTKIN_Ptkin09bG0154500 [Pterospermum kingtungense]
MMAEELEGVWSLLSLIKEEKDTVETFELLSTIDQGEGDKWLVAKLITKRPFNWDAMFNLFYVVWVLSKPLEIAVLDTNFSFSNLLSVGIKIRFWMVVPRFLRISFRLLQNLMVAECLGNKIRTLKKLDVNPAHVGWARNLCLRVEINIDKPLRWFVTVSRGAGKEDIWGRVTYERLPLFCYECGLIRHAELNCESFNRRLLATAFRGVEETMCFDKDGLGRTMVAPVVAMHSMHKREGSACPILGNSGIEAIQKGKSTGDSLRLEVSNTVDGSLRKSKIAFQDMRSFGSTGLNNIILIVLLFRSKDVGFGLVILSGSQLQLNQFDNEHAGQNDAVVGKLQAMPRGSISTSGSLKKLAR